jgi:Fe-S-cluster containining protein
VSASALRPLTLVPAAAACNGCGDCCRAIGLPEGTGAKYSAWAALWAQGEDWDYPEDHLRALVRNWRWYLVELVPMDVQEAYDRLPGLRTAAREDMGYVRGRDWFWCRNFEPETNRCLVHDDKPPACSGFPWYDRAPSSGMLVPYPRCGYYADVVRTGANIELGSE